MQDLLTAARAGDESAFQKLIAPETARLQAHCYRMLGSLYDAEDAVQETLLRAWKALKGFDGRSALGSWLYRIATNTCLNLLRRNEIRTLPLDSGFASDDPSDAAGPPLVESLWIEPYPDADTEFEARESLELAFVAALQHVPANGRAALLLTDVLGFSAREAADALDTTTASLNSALQRARKAIDERVPEQSQQATLRALGDAELNAAVERYIQAMEAADVDGVVALLTEDATWSMPPQPAWFRGRGAIGAFLEQNPFKYFEWRLRPIVANGQPAVACYSWEDAAGAFTAHSINVLEFDADLAITGVTTFLDVTRRGVTSEGFRNYREARLFERFGMPGELPR